MMNYARIILRLLVVVGEKKKKKKRRGEAGEICEQHDHTKVQIFVSRFK